MNTNNAAILLDMTDYQLGQTLRVNNEPDSEGFNIVWKEIENRYQERFYCIRNLIVNQALKTPGYVYKINDDNGLIICSLDDSFILIDQEFDKPNKDNRFRIEKYKKKSFATFNQKAFEKILSEGRSKIDLRIQNYAFVDFDPGDAVFTIQEKVIIMGEDAINILNFKGDNQFLRLKKFLKSYEPYIGELDFGEFDKVFELGLPRT